MKYRITCRVKQAVGSQVFLVDAESPASAIRKHNDGESEFDCESVEITELYPVTESCVEEA